LYENAKLFQIRAGFEQTDAEYSINDDGTSKWTSKDTTPKPIIGSSLGKAKFVVGKCGSTESGLFRFVYSGYNVFAMMTTINMPWLPDKVKNLWIISRTTTIPVM
jgi:lipocalin